MAATHALHKSRFALGVFQTLLRLYPRDFRDEYGREMALVLANRYQCATKAGERTLLMLQAFAGVLSHAPQEHFCATLRDLRYSARLLGKNPGFAITAVLSLALGIGANTAIFAVAKKVLFDALPVRDSQQLRILTWVSGHEQPVSRVWGDVVQTEDGSLASTAFSYPLLQQFRRSKVFEDLIAFKDVEMTATIDGHPEFLNAEMISGNAFSALGVATLAGRSLTANDDTGNSATPVVMISEAYWIERFARSTAVLGKSISLNGHSVTIVGIVTPTFTGLIVGRISKLFVPLTLQPLLLPRGQQIGSAGGSLLENPRSWWVLVMGRLRAGVSEARAQAILDTVLRQTTRATIPEARGLDQFHLKLQPGNRGPESMQGFEKPAYVLMGLAGLVLLLACVNLANLLMARATSRQREMSTRLALGAGRSVILRQLLTESLLLSLIGGLAGLALAIAGRGVIPHLLSESSQQISISSDFDWHLLLFAVGLSLTTGLAFGALPAWQTLRPDLNEGLRAAGHSTIGRSRVWIGRGLVVFQVGLSAVLLLAAGLFVRTLANLGHTALGFRADHILLFKINPPRSRYTDQRMVALYREFEEKVASVPGVLSVTLSNIALIGDGNSGSAFHIFGRPDSVQVERVQAISVGPSFFETMGIPMLQGRGFDLHDNAGSRKVAVVNRALVKHFFREENPIGRTFECEDVAGPVEVIGIAADTKYADLRTETPPTFYMPYRQANGSGRMIAEIRTAAEPFSVLSAVRSKVESLDHDLPLIEVRTEEQQIQGTLYSERVFAKLTTCFGIVALALATVGIYGLMAYTVARRSGDIGIRMALGARVGQVLSSVLREAILLAVAGVIIGIGISLFLARFVGSMLYGLRATDPATLILTSSILIAVSFVAGFGPALRASRVDPTNALRHE